MKSDRGIVRAEVIDRAMSADTALLRLTQNLEGHEFDMAPEAPGLGTDIGVLGYPFGVSSLRLTRGTISGEETSVTYDGPEGFTVDQVLTTDAATNGGNSGGPVIDESGKVIGLVSGSHNWSGDPTQPVPAQGTNYLVPAEVISTHIEQWKAGEPEVQGCGDEAPAPVDEDFDLDVAIDADDSAADDIALSLYVHGDSINQGLYEAAWSLFTTELQRYFKDDVEGWSQGLATSYWDQIQVEEVTRDGDRAEVAVALRTRQDLADSSDGLQSCSDWSMRYAMRLSRGVWFIDAADPGDGPDPC